MSLAILIRPAASVFERAVREDERVVRRERRELVRRGHERQTGELGDLRARRARRTRGCALSPVPTAVPPSASSYSVGSVGLDARDAVVRPARRSRRTPGRGSAASRPAVGAADLHDVGELLRLPVERVAQLRAARAAAAR